MGFKAAPEIEEIAQDIIEEHYKTYPEMDITFRFLLPAQAGKGDFQIMATEREIWGEYCPLMPPIERCRVYESPGDPEPPLGVVAPDRPPGVRLYMSHRGLYDPDCQTPPRDNLPDPATVTSMFHVYLARLIRRSGADRIWEYTVPHLTTEGRYEQEDFKVGITFSFHLEAREWDETCAELEIDYTCRLCNGSGEYCYGNCTRCHGSGSLVFRSESRWYKGREKPVRCECGDWMLDFDRRFTMGEDEQILPTRECLGCGKWQEILTQA